VALSDFASVDFFGVGLGLGCCAQVVEASTNRLKATAAKIDVVLLFMTILWSTG
jgi:hypothetical protein